MSKMQRDSRTEGIYARWVKNADGSEDLFQIERVTSDGLLTNFSMTKDEYQELLQTMQFLKTAKAAR